MSRSNGQAEREARNTRFLHHALLYKYVYLSHSIHTCVDFRFEALLNLVFIAPVLGKSYVNVTGFLLGFLFVEKRRRRYRFF